jgi:PEP-CTERM motif
MSKGWKIMHISRFNLPRALALLGATTGRVWNFNHIAQNFGRGRNMRGLLKFVAAIALLAGLSSQTQAAFTITIQQVGSNLVATGSGSINLTGISSNGFGFDTPHIAGAFASADVGATGNNISYGTTFTGGVPSFGDQFSIGETSGTGDWVGIDGQFGQLYLPPGYVSGNPLAGTGVYVGQSISSMDLVPGSYTWSWGTGPTADSFTVNIIGVPEPSSIVLGALGVGLLAIARRRRQYT